MLCYGAVENGTARPLAVSMYPFCKYPFRGIYGTHNHDTATLAPLKGRKGALAKGTLTGSRVAQAARFGDPLSE